MIPNAMTRRKPRQFFYIMDNGTRNLLHGVRVDSSGSAGGRTPIALWKPPGSFEWARRFSSIFSAVECAAECRFTNVSVIDRAGRVVRKIDEEATAMR